MQRVGGFRRKTRRKLSKNIRQKGKVSLTKFFQRLSEGDRVYLVAEPAVQKGMYFPRFHGKAGVVDGKQGSNYYIKIKDGRKSKRLLVHPVHLKKS
jgi:ribosomal protein L21E